MKTRVGLIVLCYNGVNLTLDCLRSLRRQDHAFCDLFVVDNGSQDGTLERVRVEFPEAHRIANPENLGYAAGNNVGMRAALERGADAVFLINNDTWLDSQCVPALLAALAAHPAAGIVGPMVYAGARGQLIGSGGGRVDWRHADAVNMGAGEMDEAQWPARTVDFVHGCGLLATRAAVEAAGLLDPRYFMYWEEIDWCRRVARAGFEVRFEPQAALWHKATLQVGDLGPTTLYYVTRNRLLFFMEHAPRGQRALCLARALHGLAHGIWRHRRLGRPVHARATEIAIQHALTGRWGRADPVLWLGGAQPKARQTGPLEL